MQIEHMVVTGLGFFGISGIAYYFTSASKRNKLLKKYPDVIQETFDTFNVMGKRATVEKALKQPMNRDLVQRLCSTEFNELDHFFLTGQLLIYYHSQMMFEANDVMNDIKKFLKSMPHNQGIDKKLNHVIREMHSTFNKLNPNDHIAITLNQAKNAIKNGNNVHVFFECIQLIWGTYLNSKTINPKKIRSVSLLLRYGGQIRSIMKEIRAS